MPDEPPRRRIVRPPAPPPINGRGKPAPVVRTIAELRALHGRGQQSWDRLSRHERLTSVAEMLLTGYTQTEVAAAFGVTKPTISKLQTVLEAEWAERRVQLVDAHMARELAKLDRLESEYWEAWRRSCNDRTEKGSRVKKLGRERVEMVNGHPVTTPAHEQSEAYQRVVQQVGNPAFLAGVERCIEARARLLGLHAATKVDVNVGFTLDQAFAHAEQANTIEMQRSDRDQWLATEGKAAPMVDGDIDEAMQAQQLADDEELLTPPPIDEDAQAEADALLAQMGEATTEVA